MTAHNRFRTWSIAIFIGAFALRLIYILQQIKLDPLFSYPVLDGLYHHTWASAIARGDWLGREAFFRAPLYPYFLALVYKVFGIGFIWPRIVQSLLGCGSCLLISRLGRKIFDEPTGIIAGGIAAFYPLFIYFDNELLIPSLLIFLVLAAFTLTLRAADQPGHKNRWLTCGMTWGLAAITRPNVLLFIPGLLVWLFRRYRRYATAGAGLVFCGMLLAIGPVTVRNYLVSRELVLIAWQGGYNFYIGNNPGADGRTAILPGTKKSWQGGYYDAQRLAEEAKGRPLTNAEVDRYWFGRGNEFIRTRPFKAIALFAAKAYMWIGGTEIPNNRDLYYFTRPTYLRFIFFKWPWFQFPFGLLFPLALAGCYLALRDRRDITLLLWFVGLYSLSFILFFVTARYRLTIVPFLIMLAAYAVRASSRLIRGRAWHRLKPAGFIFIPALIFCNLNLTRVRDNPSLNQLFLAELEYRKGNMTQALQYYETALPFYQQDPEVLGQMGLCYYRLGRLNDAYQYFQRSLQADPRQPSVYVNIGNIMYVRRDFAAAQKAYQTAIEYDRRYALAYENLGNTYLVRDSLPQALGSYRQALDLNPALVNSLYYSGIIQARLGNMAAAESLWRRTLQVDPNHQAAQRALSDLRRFRRP